MTGSFYDIIESLHDQYSIRPLLSDKATFIFLLESPHVHELKYQTPVAGPSGKTMSSVLLGEAFNQPLGLLVRENIERGYPMEQLNKIGIMNVTNFPLQRKAYGDEALLARNSHFFTLLERLRTANDRLTYSSPDMMQLQEDILLYFNRQLEQLIDRECTFVPCGRFAQKFFNLSSVRGKQWDVIQNIPHPSYNSWNQAKYKEEIKELRQAFHKEYRECHKE